MNSLTWQGFSFDVNDLGSTSTPVSAFNVEFYADSSGVPGALVFSETISFTQSDAGTVDFFSNGQTETIYNYSGTLSGGFTASAGTTYWLSVQGITDYPAFWTWTSGTGGDGMSYQTENPQYGNLSTSRPGDRAFSLSSVPEPSSFALCGIAGVIGLAVARVRRKCPS